MITSFLIYSWHVDDLEVETCRGPWKDCSARKMESCVYWRFIELSICCSHKRVLSIGCDWWSAYCRPAVLLCDDKWMTCLAQHYLPKIARHSAVGPVVWFLKCERFADIHILARDRIVDENWMKASYNYECTLKPALRYILRNVQRATWAYGTQKKATHWKGSHRKLNAFFVLKSS